MKNAPRMDILSFAHPMRNAALIAACLIAVTGKQNCAPSKIAFSKPSCDISVGIGVFQYIERIKSSIGFLASFAFAFAVFICFSNISRFAFSDHACMISGVSPTIRTAARLTSMGLISITSTFLLVAILFILSVFQIRVASDFTRRSSGRAGWVARARYSAIASSVIQTLPPGFR